jgi:sigma-E factor negative regulatory protein RseC
MNPHANRHLGVVRGHENRKWQIVLANPDGCAVCHRGLCFDGTNEKIVEVPERNNVLQLGQSVWVRVAEETGWRAILIFYALPFVLMFATLLVMNGLGFGEGVSGTLSIAVLLPYYGVLWLLRTQLQSNVKLFVTPV